MRYVFGFLCVCALGVMPLVGCGDNDSDCAEPVDVAGEWETTSTVVSDNCDGRMSRTFRMKITQDGNALTAETPELTFSGTICGNQIQMSGSFPEDDGTVTVNATLDVSADGKSLQGSDTWTWTDGSESCSGSDSLSGTRIMTGGCEGAVDGTACSGGACLDGACTALTTVSGTVTVEEGNDSTSPAVDATVSVVGTSLSTKTNDSGEFSFGVFTGDWFFQSEKDELWGEIHIETVPTTGLSGLELFVITDAVIAELERELGIKIDDAKGIISVNFGIAPGEALGGETAELSELYEYATAEKADGEEVLSEELFPGGGPDLTFWNVDPTEELIVTPKGEGLECGLRKPGTVYPIRARFVTLRADAQCTLVTGSNGR